MGEVDAASPAVGRVGPSRAMAKATVEVAAAGVAVGLVEHAELDQLVRQVASSWPSSKPVWMGEPERTPAAPGTSTPAADDCPVWISR